MTEPFTPFQLMLFDSLHEGISYVDRTGAVIYANKAAIAIIGVPQARASGTQLNASPWTMCREDGSPFPVEDRPAMQTVRTGESLEGVILGVGYLNGDRRWISVSSRPVFEDDGVTVRGVILTFQDITQKRRELRLQGLRLELREFAARHSLGQTLEWFLGACQSVTFSTHGQVQGVGLAPGPDSLGSVDDVGPRLTVELHHGEAASLTVTVAGKPHPYTDVDRTSLVELGTSLWDLVVQKQTEERLLMKQAGLDSSLNAFAFARNSGEITDANPAFLSLWDLDSRTEVLGRRVEWFWRGVENARELRSKVLRERSLQTNITIRTPRGNTKVVSATIHQVRDAQGASVGYMASFADITEQQQAQEELREQKEHLRIVMETLPDSLYIADRSGRITYVNRVFPWQSADEVIGSRVEKWLPQSYHSTVTRALDQAFSQGRASTYLAPGPGGTVATLQFHVTVVPLAVDGVVNSALFLARDITNDQKWVDAAQKNLQLESLGVLAGGIAHDFNNLLTGVYGNLDLAMLTSDPKLQRDHLRHTLQSLDRARGLTGQLLTFAKGGEPVRKVEPLFPLIQEVVEFTLSGSRVRALFDIEAGLGPCSIDRGQISQVVSNLALNALQAMPEGGDLLVQARRVAGEAGQVEVLFQDQGTGMARDVLARVFDPFFTTKDHGNGLGLATSRSIITRHGGRLEASSEGPGRGATFRVVLPLESAATSAPVVAASTAVRGSGRILVLDDDAMIRTILTGMLSGLGYEAVCADTGRAAIEAAQAAVAEQRPFVLALLDLTIPGSMGGVETAAELKRLLPDLPLVVASGYSSDPALARPEEFGFAASIGKPFLLRDLSDVLGRYCAK